MLCQADIWPMMAVPEAFTLFPYLSHELHSFLHPSLCLLFRHGRRAEYHHLDLDWTVDSVVGL